MTDSKFITRRKTNRGFSICEFKDLYDSSGTIQKSSLATKDAIWLGLTAAEPRILATDAIKLGIKTETEVGWVPYPIPDCVHIPTRLHLSREQVAELISILQEFVDTGEINAET